MTKNLFRSLAISLLSAGLLLPMTSAFSQTIQRVYGSDCAGVQNEFQFECSGCTFVQWQISGSHTIDSQDGPVIDMRWNSTGNNYIRAVYMPSGSGFSIFEQYNVAVSSPLTPAVSLSITSSPSIVCSNSNIQIKATPTNGGSSPFYNWYINGVNKANNSSGIFSWSSWSNNDVVTAQVTSSLGCTTGTGSGNPITIHTTSPPVGTLLLTGPATICSNNTPGSTSFFAHATDENSAPIYTNIPTYTWLRNGVGVGGGEYTSNTSFSQYSPATPLVAGETIQCKLLSNDVCASTTPLQTDPITISTTSAVTPTITIQANKYSICRGESVTFSFSTTYSTVSNYTVNGSTVAPGQSFTISNYDGSNINASVFVSGSCLATTVATGTFNGSQITIHPVSRPNISPSGVVSACTSQLITATAGSGWQYQWYKNGIAIPGATAISYNATQNGAYQVTATEGPCTGPLSTTLQLTINPAPPLGTLSIAEPASICSSSSPGTVWFSADATDDNTAPIYTNVPTYTWLRNGAIVSPGEYTSNTSFSQYTPSSPVVSGETIQCKLLSNDVCASTTPVVSNIVTVSTTSAITPVISIQPDKYSICTGESVTFSFSTTYPTTSDYSVNGSTIVPGQTFTVAGYNGSDINASVFVSGSGACLATTIATGTFSGSQITIHPVSRANISPIGSLKICSTCEQPITIVAPTNHEYQWYKNGVAIAGATNITYNATESASYTATASMFPCAGVPSFPLQLSFNVAPVINVSPDQILILPTNSVTLIGGAADTDGTIQSYAWTQTLGGNATLSGTTTNTLSISNLAAGSYGFRFTATDDFGEPAYSTVSIQVNDPPPNNYNYVRKATIMVSGKTIGSAIAGLPVEQKNVQTTYIDGLGRPMQSVAWQSSPAGNDVVQPIAYDAYGREKRKYLPYVSSESNDNYKTNGATEVMNFYSSPPNATISDSKPYSEIIFETSPLSRIIKQGSPGEVWQPKSTATDFSDRAVKRQYLLNQANEVLLWTYDPSTHRVTAKSESNLVYFPANRLFVTKTYDEHNNLVIEYMDNEERIVLKRVQATTNQSPINDTNFASTYYIYDDLGNLVVVLPPVAVEKFLSLQQ
jgi:hypothetical protein